MAKCGMIKIYLTILSEIYSVKHTIVNRYNINCSELAECASFYHFICLWKLFISADKASEPVALIHNIT